MKTGKMQLRGEVKRRINLHGFHLSERNLRLFVDTVLEAIADQLFEHGHISLSEIGTLSIETNNRRPAFGTQRQYRLKYKPTSKVKDRLEAKENS